MKKLTCIVDEEIYKKLSEKAYGMGMNNTSFLRMLIKDNLKRKKCDLQLTDIQRSIAALIPTLAEAFGIVYKVRPDQTTKFSNRLLEIWRKKQYIPSHQKHEQELNNE